MRQRTILALVFAAGVSAYAAKNSADARQFLQQIPKKDRIAQALNRLTFGPRPGDSEQVAKMGLNKWIDLQLHPDRIPENPALTGEAEAHGHARDVEHRAGETLSRRRRWCARWRTG
jgi:hypothetical protein